MSRASTLLQLQTIDLEIDAHQARLEAIERALGDDPALRDARQNLVAAEARLHSARLAVQNLEFDNQMLSEKIAEVSDRTYGGKVSSPKQLQDLQLDLASLQRRRAALEEQQFEALLAAEAAEVNHAGLRHAFEQAEAAMARTHGSLIEERRQLQTAMERLRLAREGVEASVSQADRELYERLRGSKRGRAVTRLEDGVCTSCGVAPSSSRVQSARQGNELILCGNCGRILCAD